MRLPDPHQLSDEQLALGQLPLQALHVRARPVIHLQYNDPSGGVRRALSRHCAPDEVQADANQEPFADGSWFCVAVGGSLCVAEVHLCGNY